VSVYHCNNDRNHRNLLIYTIIQSCTCTCRWSSTGVCPTEGFLCWYSGWQKEHKWYSVVTSHQGCPCIQIQQTTIPKWTEDTCSSKWQSQICHWQGNVTTFKYSTLHTDSPLSAKLRGKFKLCKETLRGNYVWNYKIPRSFSELIKSLGGELEQ